MVNSLSWLLKSATYFHMDGGAKDMDAQWWKTSNKRLEHARERRGLVRR